MNIFFYSENLMGRDEFGRWEDNIKMDIEETGCELISPCSGEGRVAGCCEHDNEPPGSIKCKECLDKLSGHQLLSKDCTLWC
jgi:predicted adenine nucleotide alpha hydrolase (AANH) superfamily ATPase